MCRRVSEAACLLTLLQGRFLYRGLSPVLVWLLAHAPSEPEGNNLSQTPKRQ